VRKSALALALPIVLLVVLWATRITALDIFPLHTDEGLHLTRAIEVWHLHPFWEINDGKIINHWLIALFYPQNAPVFVGRIATVFIALIGLAAAYALTRHYFGTLAAFLAGALWITSPYLFLYERFAFADAESGALLVVTLLLSLRLARTGGWRDAILTGLALALAALFKLTAAPFALMVFLIVMLVGKVALRRRIGNLVLIGVVVAACFAVPVIYVFAHGGGFSIALSWIAGSDSTSTGTHGVEGCRACANLVRLGQQLVGFGSALWAVALVAGLVALILLSRRWFGLILVVAAMTPMAVMVFLGTDVQPRHFVVALPLALTLAGAGLGVAIELRLQAASYPEIAFYAPSNNGLGVVLAAAIGGFLLYTFAPFAAIAYTDPGHLPLPPLERQQYVTDHSAGFGLREAVITLSSGGLANGLPVIASMFADSCRRANFYATSGFLLTCVDAPGLGAIQTALADRGAVYVLVERPPIGLDMSQFGARAQRVGSFPRPGETPDSASVVLWRLEK